MREIKVCSRYYTTYILHLYVTNFNGLISHMFLSTTFFTVCWTLDHLFNEKYTAITTRPSPYSEGNQLQPAAEV